MSRDIDETHDPRRKAFFDVPADTDFPIQNLPFGVFVPRAGTEARVGVAIGDRVLDLAVLEREDVLRAPVSATVPVFGQGALNAFLAMGRPAWRATRAAVSRLLSGEDPALRDDRSLQSRALHDRAEITMRVPAEIGDYTDFYSSREHATNVGTMFRGPENALMPNWLHLPVAYHGRASSVVVSGTDVRRPCGQRLSGEAATPVFGPSQALDFELEAGVFVGPGNALGEAVPIARAAEHLFGMVLVNDWSARDIQSWEYQPLGPFLAKSFATSISPWVVTLEALEPFRVPAPVQDPEVLPYLRRRRDAAYDLRLEVHLQTRAMTAPVRICASNHRYLYWDVLQQLAHHTVNGCNLRPGDLLASGTISGPEPTSRGSLLEITWRGRDPIELPGGERRTFLEDGDWLAIVGWCESDDVRVGLGRVEGRVQPAPSPC